MRALRRAASSQYQCVAVVVCRPVLSAAEISPTCAAASATMRLTSVLLPAPLGPSTSVALSSSRGASRADDAAAAFFNATPTTSTPGVGYGARRPSAAAKLGRSPLLRTTRAG